MPPDVVFQVDASLDALSTLKSILDLGVLEANLSRLLKAQYFRCLAYAFTREPKAVLKRTGISSSTSPLSILEQARADLISFVQQSSGKVLLLVVLSLCLVCNPILKVLLSLFGLDPPYGLV